MGSFQLVLIKTNIIGATKYNIYSSHFGPFCTSWYFEVHKVYANSHMSLDVDDFHWIRFLL